MELRASSTVLWSERCRGEKADSKNTDPPDVPCHGIVHSGYVYQRLPINGHKPLLIVLDVP